MGAWRPAIFSDDTACDVRDAYKTEVANGVEGSEATRTVLSGFAESLDDPDDGPVVWLALAATQWRLGRLDDDVKAKALEVIDTGLGLGLWEEAGHKLLAKRKAALQKLRDQLVSPQPPRKKITKPFCPPIYLGIQVGDAISYQTLSGDYVIFRCVENDIDLFHCDFPRFDILDWKGLAIPSPSEISRMPYAKETKPGRSVNIFHILARRKRDFPVDRVQIVARGLRFNQPSVHVNLYWFMGWDTIEEDIQANFRLTPGGPRGLRRWFRR